MKSEHGVPIPRRASFCSGTAGVLALAVVGVLAFDVPIPARTVVVVLAVGVALVLFAVGFAWSADVRRQTRVIRAALGYRRGERPWTWGQHRLQALSLGLIGAGFMVGALSGAGLEFAPVGIFALANLAAVAWSAVQKRRHERSDLERFGPPEAYRSR